MRNRTAIVAAFALGASVLALGAPASAHHSFAMFDRQKEVVLKGTVKAFQWTNPHSFIEIDVADDKGSIQAYSVEMNSPNNLTRQGWKSTSLKPGDKVTVVMNPLRDGAMGGLFISVQLADGKVLGDPTRIPAAPPAKAG
jgi:Family of unknown function (DUF6152)